MKRLYGKRIYIDSAGVEVGQPNSFVNTIMEEIGIDISGHQSKLLDDIADQEFDLIISFSPAAHRKALAMCEKSGGEAIYWPMPDPSENHGSRQRILDAYRGVRGQILAEIKSYFGWGVTVAGASDK